MGAEFDGKKIILVGGSAGMGRRAALDVVDRGGSARSKGRVDETVAEMTDRRGKAWGIAIKLN
jgi:NAD(P)-dependent dehydrogenase (short-subunit alcohol dehydrogenase family)